jgi:hypothetical protein
MGRVLILREDNPKAKIENVKNNNLSITDNNFLSQIEDQTFTTESVESKDYSLVEIESKLTSLAISEILPFRIRITNIGVGSYGPNNPAPIGIAVIGINNYIL